MHQAKKRFISSFVPPSFYVILKRLQLKRHIRQNRNGKIKIVLGAGGLYEPGWIPTSYETINVSNEADWARFFSPDSIDLLMAEHMWEHLATEHSLKALRICYKYLKHGGKIRIAVPDGFHPNPLYIKGVDVEKDAEGINHPETHKVLYNYKTLQKELQDAGFRTNLLEYFDEQHQFHRTDWDKDEGLIYRSERFKFRRSDVSILNLPDYTSLIIDGVKPL